MRFQRQMIAALLGLGLLSGTAQARTDAPATHRFFHVQLAAAQPQPVSGRLLLFAIDAQTAEAAAKAASAGKDSTVASVDANPFRATQTAVAAREVSHWAPGQRIDLDADQMAFPTGYSQLPAGDYLVQAVLDVDHNYNYGGRGAGDLVSEVVKLHLPTADIPTLQLTRRPAGP